MLEQEIKRTEPEIYIRMKEFMVGRDSKVGYMELYRFAEDIGYDLFRKKSLSSRLRQHGEEKLAELLMDLCFEVMYSRLIDLDENSNIMFQEKLFIL